MTRPPFKIRQIADGLYEIVGTTLVISRDPPPRYRCPQEWSIALRETPEIPLLTGKSRAHALDCLTQLVNGCHWVNGATP